MVHNSKMFPNIVEDVIVEYWPTATSSKDLLQHVEKIGRVCYRSEDRITDISYEKFIRGLIDKGHEAMIEHASITLHFKVDRGVTHEMVRHRLAAFAQSSTRYVNYSKDKFGNNIEVVQPFYFNVDSPRRTLVFPLNSLKSDLKDYMFEGNEFDVWLYSMMVSNWAYITLTKEFGRTAQEARSVLPQSTAADIVITANFREWRHILKLRSQGVSGSPHPDIKKAMDKALQILYKEFPIIFEDIYNAVFR